MAQTPAQQFLPIEEIRNGLLLLNDRSVRGILMVSSQNFALKSAEEQEATIYQFQNFLNSLDFSLQIVMQSRRLNITGYIESLKELETRQTNILLREQTADYRAFVERLIGEGSIMAKNFFIVVPFYLGEAQIDRQSSRSLSGAFSRTKAFGKVTDEEFERIKSQIWQRMEFVALGLRRSGLNVAPLNTEEVIELLWSWHHPKEAEVGYYPEIPPELTQL